MKAHDVTRPVVLLRKDVAPNFWHESFAALAALGESGEDGVQVATQKGSSSDGYVAWSFSKIAPEGWAAYYAGEHGKAFLHVQNW